MPVIFLNVIYSPSSSFQEQQRLAERQKTGQQQQLFQLRSIKSSIRNQEEKTRVRQKERKAKQEAQKCQPRRLGRLKYVCHLTHLLSQGTSWCQRFGSIVEVQQLCLTMLKHLWNYDWEHCFSVLKSLRCLRARTFLRDR